MPLRRIGELETIYSELAPQLEKIVMCNLGLSDAVLEEACQFAWGQLALRRPQVVPGHELGWLTTTAIRAALRLVRAGRGDVSLDDEEQHQHLAELGAVAPGPESAIEVRDRLAAVLQLPVRQRRMLLMHGFGYGYREIADQTGDSRRTVERQLHRARQHLRVSD
jgi:RNA polymerase sigma factor (sigma-70 family)